MSDQQLDEWENYRLGVGFAGLGVREQRALVGEVRASRAREAELRAKVNEMTEDYVPMVSNDFQEQQAQNYIEMKASSEEGRWKGITATCRQRWTSTAALAATRSPTATSRTRTAISGLLLLEENKNERPPPTRSVLRPSR